MSYDVARAIEALDSLQISYLEVEDWLHSAHVRESLVQPVSHDGLLVAYLLHALLRVCHAET